MIQTAAIYTETEITPTAALHGRRLVGGEGFAIDASVIKADANRTRGMPGGQEINWSQGEGPSRAVREYLSALDASNPTDGDEPPAAGHQVRRRTSR